MSRLDPIYAMDIEVVLTESDPKLGERGQVIKVAPGHAYNFLIPQGKALLATAANLKSFEAEKARRARQGAESLERARDIAEKLKALTLRLEMPTGESDKLYGAVTSQHIEEGLRTQGISVERKEIRLDEPIRKLGHYEVAVKLHPEVKATLKMEVVRSAGS